MSAHVVRFVQCDRCRNAAVHLPSTRWRALRKLVRQAGWVTAGASDVCPSCAGHASNAPTPALDGAPLVITTLGGGPS